MSGNCFTKFKPNFTSGIFCSKSVNIESYGPVFNCELPQTLSITQIDRLFPSVMS